jgi:hypothetical protein
MKIDQIISESVGVCSECGGPSFTDLILAEKKDACYHKVKASAKVWPSAYASGRLVQCRKKGASNYGNKSEGVEEDISRRGFLKGAGAAAVAGAAGVSAAKAQSFDAPGATADEIAQGKYIRPYLGFIRKVVNPLVRVDNSQPTDNLKTTIVLTWNTQNGNILDIQASDNSPWSQAVLNAFNQAFPTKQLPKGWELTGAPQRPSYKMILNFTPQQVYGTNESVEQGVAEGEVDEGWKETLGAATLAGAMALGSAGAQARVTPDGQGGFTGGMKPAATVTAPVPARIDSPSGPSGFSKEYLQKAADPNRTGRYMISIEKAQELLKQTNEGTAGLPDPNNFDSDWEYQDALDAYGKTQDNDSDFENMTDEPDDWFDESKEKVGNMDADDFDAAMARLKKLAGAGPMKTVYDPDRRVYRNMPTAQQPPKQLKK